MSFLVLGTNTVSMDEPCYGLAEVNLQSPGNRGFHRYLIVQVMRDDKVVEFRKDLGLSKKFKHDSVNIPGGVTDQNGKIYIEHTVGELLSFAEAIRNKPSFDKRELAGVERING